MIITQSVDINGRAFTRTYSSEGRYVVRDGISYEEAYDPSEYNRQYTEGEYITIGITQNIVDDDDELTDEQAAAYILGGTL